ncbi:MAG: ABC transporter permease [Thermodesulfobacteriota bacterium]|nr:ABC transporter permease [Thermodesulfobacteriota bacterium]
MEEIFDKAEKPKWSQSREVLHRLSKRITAMIGLVIVLIFLISAIFAPFLALHDPLEHSLGHMLAKPSWDYPLGRDELGRCILSRVIYGARISLLIGTMVISIGVLLGAPLGIISAYYGGKVDFIIQRFVDTMLAFPGILLALTLIAMLGVGLANVMIAVGISTIPIYARLARSSVLAIKSRQFVEASRSIGASNFKIILRHLLPNSLSPIIVQSTLHMATAILWAAGLGFLGLGINPPTPEWGAMLNGGRLYIRVAYHVATFPGLMIFITVLGFNLLGDGLRDALDPRLKT